MFFVFWFTATRTTFGRSVYAVGGNPSAARLSGIPVRRIRMLVFGLTGLMAAVVGILLAARLAAGSADIATGLEFNVIAAVIVGGTSLYGGTGSIVGTILGVLLHHHLEQRNGPDGRQPVRSADRPRRRAHRRSAFQLATEQAPRAQSGRDEHGLIIFTVGCLHGLRTRPLGVTHLQWGEPRGPSKACAGEVICLGSEARHYGSSSPITCSVAAAPCVNYRRCRFQEPGAQSGQIGIAAAGGVLALTAELAADVSVRIPGGCLRRLNDKLRGCSHGEQDITAVCPVAPEQTEWGDDDRLTCRIFQWPSSGFWILLSGATMSPKDYVLPPAGPVPDPDEAEFAELARLRERFRRHHIFRNVIPGRGVRYLAHSAAAGIRPHTLITSDLAELQDELEQATQQELSTGFLWHSADMGKWVSTIG